MRIDAHLHVWQPACGFDNRPIADHAFYRRDFMPADVAPALREAGIDAAILVQTCPQVEETAWMLEVAARTPWIVGITGWVDLDQPKADLAPLTEHPVVVGLRAQLRRVADDAFVARPNVVRNLARARDAGLALTLLAEHRHRDHVARVLDLLPAGPITLNHLGMPFPDVDRDAWRSSLNRYAARPDVYLQLSGLPFLHRERWREPAAQALLDDVLDRFGASRLLFASDWPMLLRFASYVDWARAAEAFLQCRGLGAADIAAVFGGNALRANPRLRLPTAPQPLAPHGEAP
jgi:L-fuconolactonase